MTNDSQFVADRLVWRFKKSGGEGVACKPFSAFPDHVQDSVLLDARLREDEVASILCHFSETKWTLLTTERLVWKYDRASVSSVDLARIEKTTPEKETMGRGGKLAQHVLTIVETAGARHHLELEPGRPFFGFWNAVIAAVPRSP
jgi:hypothetical protein